MFEGPFTLAIFAAIFAAISSAISRRVNYWRFRGDSLHEWFEIAAKSHLKSTQKSTQKSPVSTGLYKRRNSQTGMCEG